jgi:hypothetical protein
MSGDNPKIVEIFPKADVSSEERARRLLVEVERLARLPPAEWMLYLPDVAKKYGVSPDVLKKMIEKTINANEKKAREDRAENHRSEQRAAKEQTKARREQREQKQADKEAERARKEAEQIERERQDALEAIAKLPRSAHEEELAKLALRTGDAVDLLHDELNILLDVVTETLRGRGEVKPWPDPVDTKELFDEVLAQLRRYYVIHYDSTATMLTLATLFAWVIEITRFSPIFVIEGGDLDTGKSELCELHSHLTPRAQFITDPTKAALFRLVDHSKPSLYIDDADSWLPIHKDLAVLLNSSWTRGRMIPRTEHGVVRYYDPFCFKMINGIDVLPHLAPATRTRCIVLKVLPKLDSEKIECRLSDADTDERFLVLQRKQKRWAADHLDTLRGADPLLPKGLDSNRQADNYRLLIALGDLVGKDCGKHARKIAVELARVHDVPSLRRRVLLCMLEVAIAQRDPQLISDELPAQIIAIDDTLADYRGPNDKRSRGHPITKHEIAKLVAPLGVRPGHIYPHGRSKSIRGYDLSKEDCATAIRHYLRREPLWGKK